MSVNLQRASGVLVLVTAVTTLAGYARELVVASRYGIGGVTDAFFLTLPIVQTAVDLIFIGTLGAMVVPLLSGLDQPGRDGSAQRAGALATITLVVAVTAAALAAILWLLMTEIIDTIAPGMGPFERTTSARMGHALVWLLPLNALVALFALALNARKSFILAAVPYLGNHVIFIVALLALAPTLDADALPIACLAGPVVFLPILATGLTRLGLLNLLEADLSRRSLVPLWRLARPNLLSAGLGSSIGLLMVSHLIIRGFAASHSMSGAVAALGYAYKLYEVPMSLFVNPIATVIFPVLAAMHLDSRTIDFGALCRQLLAWGLIVMVPTAVVTWAGADVIVDLLLRRGRFDLEAARLTAEALRGFAPAIAFEAVVVVLFRAFLAMHRPTVPVLAATLALASLVGILFTGVSASPFAIALSLSGGLGVAALTLIVVLASVCGRTALPEPGMIARWTLGALGALALWRLAVWSLGGDGAPAQVMGAAVFLAAYALLLAALLPDYRTRAAGAIRSGLGAWAPRAEPR